MSTFKTELKYPADLRPRIIGRGGENIRALQDEFKGVTDIRLSREEPFIVTISGEEGPVKRCRAKLESQIKSGSFGDGTRSNAPRAGGADRIDPDKWAAMSKEEQRAILDARRQASRGRGEGGRGRGEGGRGRSRDRPSREPRSQERDGGRAQSDDSNTVRLQVDDSMRPVVIGQRGTNIRDIEERSGAKVDLRDGYANIRGDAKQVAAAKKFIEEVISRGRDAKPDRMPRTRAGGANRVDPDK